MEFLLSSLDLLFTLLAFAIIARAVASWLPIDRYHPAVQFFDQVTEPILAPLRRYIPPLGGTVDITPIVALILLQILQAIVHSVLVGIYLR